MEFPSPPKKNDGWNMLPTPAKTGNLKLVSLQKLVSLPGNYDWLENPAFLKMYLLLKMEDFPMSC